MRIAVLADIGQHTYHVGDEAIGLQACRLLQDRGHKVTLITRDIIATLRATSDQTDAIWATPFPINPGQRHLAYLHAKMVVDQAISSPTLLPSEVAYVDSELVALVRELEQVDALLIAGGGSLNSQYGWLFLERLLAMYIAQKLGKPYAISGQTLGPALTETDQDLATDIFNHAAILGWRDESSLTLAKATFPDANHQLVIDDASFFPHKVPNNQSAHGEKTEQYVLVSLNPETDDTLGADPVKEWAKFLDKIHEITHLPTLLVPHMAPPRSNTWDEEFTNKVAKMMTSPVVALPVEQALVSANRVNRAALVISARFHPMVFGLARAVPVIGLAQNAYTAVRMTGLCAHWQRPDAVHDLSLISSEESKTPASSNSSSRLLSTIKKIWENRAEISKSLEERGNELQAIQAAWYDMLGILLQKQTPPGNYLQTIEQLSSSHSQPPLPTDLSFPDLTARLDQEREEALAALSEQETVKADLFGLIGRHDTFADARFAYDYHQGPWINRRPLTN
ncbi:hypothetical protein BK816_03385 [Boudabousia tangfeifanii]|uniref:Polysaccharide pyruvyl transferase domain-containing protein n=1 Tax=Boudabousia tangfeifanii TaxID=1912795 RepID=A0A1D9MJU4_9ACTO|nr:polysaccharide pyruvyl transferase family protein [Boudabousia tangfeifanii]AOZ72453.1 hypothetical protein BK816_03385 [Boudabousia tangfeifanii]